MTKFNSAAMLLFENIILTEIKNYPTVFKIVLSVIFIKNLAIFLQKFIATVKPRCVVFKGKMS